MNKNDAYDEKAKNGIEIRSLIFGCAALERIKFLTHQGLQGAPNITSKWQTNTPKQLHALEEYRPRWIHRRSARSTFTKCTSFKYFLDPVLISISVFNTFDSIECASLLERFQGTFLY